MIELVFPQSNGEWLAWLVAMGCILVGLSLILMPRVFMRIVGLGDSVESSVGVSEIRGIVGGLFFGFGLACILFAQPLVTRRSGWVLPVQLSDGSSVLLRIGRWVQSLSRLPLWNCSVQFSRSATPLA